MLQEESLNLIIGKEVNIPVGLVDHEKVLERKIRTPSFKHIIKAYLNVKNGGQIQETFPRLHPEIIATNID